MSRVIEALDQARKAQEVLKQAQQNFEFADLDHIEIAILDLQYAEDRLGILNRIASKEVLKCLAD